MAVGQQSDAYSNQLDHDPTAGRDGAVGTAFDAIAEIQAYEKEFQKWEQRGKQIIRRYRDERSEATNLRVVSRKMNILWSNTETLKPTLYARLPRVQVERRFKDADPVGRTACEIAERAGNYLLETSPYDNVMRLCVQDLLLPGRGVSWINYMAELSEVEAPMGSDEDDDGEDEPESELEKIKEKVEPFYVDWRDFGHSPKRTWQEVTRAWRICHMTKKQLVKRFGEKMALTIPMDEKADNNGEKRDAAPDMVHDTARIYEVWDKEHKKVCWVHKSHKDYLDEIDPPVDLEAFWPFPRPLWSNLTNDSLTPIAYYLQYQDQAAELDKITNRIGRFTDGLKLAGVYDSSVTELSRLLSPNGTPDNIMIPVSNWNALVQKGGTQGVMQFVPVQEIAATLLSLYQAREQILNVIYQVTGIADIIRGSSNPNETATAQSIKGQFASLRIKDLQAEVARFARDGARIMVEMAVEMYEPDTLYQMVQADQFCKPSPREQQMAQLYERLGMPTPKPMDEFSAALKLLRDDKLRSFHVDIETDSTIAMNEQEDKQNVTEFLTALGQFMGNFGPMVQQMPQLAPVAGEALLYATRRYKAGRSLESSIEKAVQQIAQIANQPKQDPEMVKAQQEMQLKQAEMQADAQAKAAEAALKQRQQELDAGAKQQDLENSLQLGREKNANEYALGQQRLAQERALKEQELAQNAEMKRHEMAAKATVPKAEKKPSVDHSPAIAAAMNGMAQAITHLNRPKRAIRDEKGRLIGSETV